MLSIMAQRATAVARASASHAPKLSLLSNTTTRGYHESIVEHYENPRNVGSLDKDDANVGTVSLNCRHFVQLLNGLEPSSVVLMCFG
jgi:hypothetical protein